MKKIPIVVLALAVVGVGAGVYFLSWISGPGGEGGEDVEVTIAQGSSAQQIAETLESSRVVDSALAFRLFLRREGVGPELRAGDYQLRISQPFDELLSELKKGPPAEYVELTIAEGLNIKQTAEAVEAQTHISEADFLEAATPDRVTPALLPQDGETLEGFLYPSTYFVEEKETAETLVARMIQEFDERTRDLGLSEPNDFGLSPYEVLVLASLVEEEAKADEERRRISAVIHNRVESGMALGIDATIQYAVDKYHGEPLTVSDLAIDSPFNSRTNAGLPPHPISSPRAGSIEAALNPADDDATYYVLTEDCLHHFFTSDYNEFLAAKARQPSGC
ncbi:MAG: endolytic transglycosylase MltG [Actinomycetota bacterium]